MKRAEAHHCYELVVRENPDGSVAQGVPTFRHDVAEEWQRLGHRVELLVHTTCEHGPGHLSRTLVRKDRSKDGTPEEGSILVVHGTYEGVRRIDATHTLEAYIEQATRMKNGSRRSAVVLQARGG